METVSRTGMVVLRTPDFFFRSLPFSRNSLATYTLTSHAHPYSHPSGTNIRSTVRRGPVTLFNLFISSPLVRRARIGARIYIPYPATSPLYL